MAIHQMVDSITLATWTIPNAFAVFMCILLFTALVITLVACTMIRIMRNLVKRTNQISASVQSLSTQITSLVTLGHQRLFAEAVYNLIALQHMQQSMYPDEYPENAKPDEAQFVVFHPSSDWHPSFLAHSVADWDDEFMDEGKGAQFLDRVHLFNSPTKLATYLDSYTNARGTERLQGLPIMYILLPSTHTYTLPMTLRVSEAVKPVRVVGQTDCSGKPYCRACIIGVDPSDVVDVDLLAEHEAPDYALRESAFDKRLYPLLWLLIVLLWSKEQLGHLFSLLGDIVWNRCGCLLWPY